MNNNLTCNEVRNFLDDYIDGTLSAHEQEHVELHLRSCTTCQRELGALRALLSKTGALPGEIAPPHDLWSRIENRLGPQKILAGPWETHGQHFSAKESPPAHIDIRDDAPKQPYRRGTIWLKRAFVAAATLIVGIGSFWLASQPSGPAWQVARLEGAPSVGKKQLTSAGKISLGDVLVTDASSRARIDVGVIGNVEVEPNSRVRLLQAQATNHRLALERGTIHAKIWAPPRLFFVETPSATAIDLGCEYTLVVNEQGSSILQVTSGWVALEFGGRESFVPAGAVCVTRSGFGPGTPCLEDASEKFRSALENFDFKGGGPDALGAVLAEARNLDSITLWHLLFRTNGTERARVYDRLTELVPPPKNVTRDGVLNGDKEMLTAWQKHLNLGVKSWWRFWQ